MKNKIVTLICILAIVVTTAIVAFASDGNVQYKNDSTSSVDPDSLISHAVSGDTGFLYPGSSLSRTMTITAGGSNDIIVRNIFAFEAENLGTKDEFDKLFNVSFSDNGWQLGDEWFPITHENEYYMMTYAVYEGGVSKGDSVFMSYSVYMDEDVSSSIAEQFDDGDGYEVLVSSQAVQADGWKTNTGTVEMNEVTIIDNILDQVFGEVKADYAPVWDDSVSLQTY